MVTLVQISGSHLNMSLLKNIETISVQVCGEITAEDNVIAKFQALEKPGA